MQVKVSLEKQASYSTTSLHLLGEGYGHTRSWTSSCGVDFYKMGASWPARETKHYKCKTHDWLQAMLQGSKVDAKTALLPERRPSRDDVLLNWLCCRFQPLPSWMALVWPWPEHNKQPIQVQILHHNQAFGSSDLTHSTWRRKKGKTVHDGNEATGLRRAPGLGLSYWFSGVKLGLALHVYMYRRL